MAASLTRSLIESHLADGAGRGRGPATGAEMALRIDQAWMDAEAATLVFQTFEAIGRPRVQIELALACVESPPPPPMFEAGDALLFAQRAARRYGVHLSRAGNGRAHHVHAARFAAPGRTVVGPIGAPSSAGAFGSLALAASELELAAILAGAPHVVAMPPIWAVRLTGTLPPWLDGHDLMRGLSDRLPAHGAAGAVLEFTGPGVAALPQEARLTAARGANMLGATASVFPSDAVTRQWLLGQGREPDWKALAGEPEDDAARVIELDLDALEPMIARQGVERPMPVREVAEIPVGRVVLGPDAGLADLMLLAAVVRDRSLAPDLELIVIPGSRQIRDTAASSGALAGLTAAGARVLDAELRVTPAVPVGAAVLCGASSRVAGRARAIFHAGPALAAAAALSGRLADPRELPLAPPASEIEVRVEVNDGLLVKPVAAAAAAEVTRGAGVGPLPALPPIVSTLRGVVLLRLGDRVGTEAALPCGPTVRRHHTDLAALAGHLYGGADPGFAARARAHGGGFVVAGGEYGIGARRPHAALALVQLGVRAVLARSFAPEHRAELIRHGVLALRFAGGAEQDRPAEGDELEIPGLPEVLEPNRPLAVRDLTCGAQFTLHHDLSAREIAIVRAGGLVSAMAPAAVGA